MHLNQGIRLLYPCTYCGRLPAAAKTSTCISPLLALASLGKKAAGAGGDGFFYSSRDSGEQNCGVHHPCRAGIGTVSPLYENKQYTLTAKLKKHHCKNSSFFVRLSFWSVIFDFIFFSFYDQSKLRSYNVMFEGKKMAGKKKKNHNQKPTTCFSLKCEF